MSEPRIAALVCEGQTDVPILRAALQRVWPSLEEVRCLQPELDETDRAKGPAGWTQVKTWCERYAADLDDVLKPDVGDRIDLLVIAIDLDIAIAAKIANPPRNLGAYEAKRLRRVVEGWLRTDPRRALPQAVVISTPVMAIETWVIAALFPQQKAPEAILHPADWLQVKKKLRISPSSGSTWKELHVYRDFAPRVAGQLKRVRSSCPEAERTLASVERVRARLEQAL